MARRKRIAFIRPKAWPLANQIVSGVIQEQFPDHEVDIINVSSLVGKRPGIVLVNSIATVLLYGKDIALGRKKFRVAFWRTPFIFRQVRRLLRARVSKGGYDFSFQMQSLFDGSSPGIPHFVYTDNTHLENRNSLEGRRNLFSPKWIALEKEIYQHAALTFVRSSNVQRSVVQDYGIEDRQVVVAYAGSNAHVGPVKIQNTEYTQREILFVGLDWKRKGGPDLVKAFQIVLQVCPDARLTIIGARPEINVENCEVVGPLKPEELDPYYQRASVFCLPTHLEPFGIVFIEAMTAHLPIVATRVGAIPDFVENGRNGWLVRPGNVQGIADALIKLLKNPSLCKKFGEHSFELARDRYSWKAVGEILHHNIQDVLSSSGEKETHEHTL